MADEYDFTRGKGVYIAAPPNTDGLYRRRAGCGPTPVDRRAGSAPVDCRGQQDCGCRGQQVRGCRDRQDRGGRCAERFRDGPECAPPPQPAGLAHLFFFMVVVLLATQLLVASSERRLRREFTMTLIGVPPRGSC
jgi:hypothetical protein